MAKRRARRGGDMQLDLFADLHEPPPPKPPTGLAAAVATPATTAPEPAGEAPPALTPPPDAGLTAAVATAKARPRISPSSPVKLAERVQDAWYGHYGGSDIDIPLGVVAALSLVRQADPDGPSLEAQFLGLDGPELLDVLRQIWSAQWMRQPYLVEIARPLHDWLERDDLHDQVVIGVRAVAQAAIKSGLLSITGDPDPQWRCQEDVLGVVLVTLRSKGGRDALGEFHTPTPAADMMAKMLLTPDSIQPGMSFDEPAAGTGGMLRAIALALREYNHNPHDFVWSMGELSATAAACAAVNSIVWDLGPNVFIHVGDTLAVGDTFARAAEHRKSVLEHHDQVMGQLAMAEAIRKSRHLLGLVTSDAA